MPQQLTPETIERYQRALQMRDAGHTFAQIANACGYADPATARYAWIGGLRLAGRANEIPQRTARTVAVTVNNGRTTRVLTLRDADAYTTPQHTTFGIEVECCLGIRSAYDALRNAGYDCQASGYTHQVMPQWKVVSDASINARNGGAEVVSPVLSGNDGLREVRAVMRVLRDAGANVNSSCGMHIHIGVDGAYTREQQARIIEQYGQWQYAFTAWMLETRIRNSYCRLRTRDEFVQLARDWRSARNARTFAGQQGRYYAFNVNSFQRYGTFEIRNHHGSLNGMNASAWVALHLAFFAKAAREDDLRLRRMDGQQATTPRNETLANGSTYTHNEPTTRAAAVQAAIAMVRMLVASGDLDATVGEYLTRRAGNIPSARSNNH